MESITVSLFLLLAVVVSGWLQRGLPWSVPLPIVQIALGALIALVAKAPVQLDPDVFFLLFLPPLLFLDGWRIPKEGLFRDKDTILELAVGLVIFTRRQRAHRCSRSCDQSDRARSTRTESEPRRRRFVRRHRREDHGCVSRPYHQPAA